MDRDHNGYIFKTEFDKWMNVYAPIGQVEIIDQTFYDMAG